MSTLAEVYASAGNDVIVRTLECFSEAWDSPVLLCNGFEDRTATTEDGRVLLFTAFNLQIQLPKRNNKGNQTLTLGLDNTSGEVQRKINAALESDKRVVLTYRTYLLSNLSAPAESPYVLTLQGGSIQGYQASLQAGYMDLIGVGWPRDSYTINFAPALAFN